MKRSNIPIFVAHEGCPNRCSFCDQHMISGASAVPDAAFVRECCETALRTMKNPAQSEIAFFGGSFTAIDRKLMQELLYAAVPYVRRGDFYGIRISTRPDCISQEILDTLKLAGVTSIELGAQSLDDSVLRLNLRGHTASETEKACEMIRGSGFSLGLQLMPGLYGSTSEKELCSISRVIALRPDTVRIYPVAVLRGTLLERLWREGIYILRDFDDILDVCAAMLEEFIAAGITVLRCGLHASENVAANAVAGYYHPAFRELAEGRIYRRLLEKIPMSGNILHASVRKGCLSKALGHKRVNAEYFKKKGITLKISEDEAVEKYKVVPCPHINTLQ